MLEHIFKLNNICPTDCTFFPHPLCYSRFSLAILFIHSSVYMSILVSQFILPPLLAPIPLLKLFPSIFFLSIFWLVLTSCLPSGGPQTGSSAFLSFTCGFHLLSGWVSVEPSFAILCVYPPLPRPEDL